MNPCIGILSETKNVWERRVSLTPSDCKLLIDQGIKILVQPSPIRCFTDAEYEEIGAELTEDFSSANVILGIQCPESSKLIENKTFLYFSHMQKGQNCNLAILETVMEKKIRLIDYECIREKSKEFIHAKRSVSFGEIAGIAGTVNIFKGIGELLLSRKISTPFIFSKMAHMYTSVKDAKANLEKIGNIIEEQHLYESICPFVIGILGNGRAASGVLEALKCLPHLNISPEEVLKGNIEKRRDLIYICVFGPDDIFQKFEDRKKRKLSDLDFDKEDLCKNPENYQSNFEKYLKNLSVLINCLYWEPSYPKLLSKNSFRQHVLEHDSKIIGISDISCDLNGSIEILSEYTNYRKPFFIYEPISKSIINEIDKATKEGIIYHAIPNLAASFPEDASILFSKLLFPYVKKLAFSEYPKKFEEQNDIPEDLLRACITSNGTLTPRYRNIFRKMEEKTKLVNLQEKSDQPFFASVKVKGHIFDSGFFNELINIFPAYKVSHKVNYLNIGDDLDFFSVFYFDVYGESNEIVKNFLDYIEESKKKFNFEMDLMKTNIL